MQGLETTVRKELNHCSIEWLESESIVFLTLYNDVSINGSAANEIIGVVLNLTGNQSFSIIIDARDKLGSINAEGREILSTHPEYNKFRKKSAFIVNNLSIRLLVNFYQKVNLKNKNTKTFSTLEKGVKWVKAD